jgi:hypothetical protein
LPGSKLPIEVVRNNNTITLYVVLGSFSEEPSPIPGVELSVLSPQSREEYSIPETVRGVVVVKSTGETETFKEGVVLVEINGAPIANTEHVSQNLYSGINRFYVWYRGNYRFLAYRIP